MPLLMYNPDVHLLESVMSSKFYVVILFLLAFHFPLAPFFYHIMLYLIVLGSFQVEGCIRRLVGGSSTLCMLFLNRSVTNFK